MPAKAPRWTDPVIEAFKKDIDRSLIQVNLRLTPEQRIRNLQSFQHFAEELSRAGEKLRSRQ